MDLFFGLFLAELFRCVSEHGVMVNDAWHVSIVGVNLSGCISAHPVSEYVCVFITKWIIVCISVCFK
jgi:hypothetical protein